LEDGKNVTTTQKQESSEDVEIETVTIAHEENEAEEAQKPEVDEKVVSDDLSEHPQAQKLEVDKKEVSDNVSQQLDEQKAEADRKEANDNLSKHAKVESNGGISEQQTDTGDDGIEWLAPFSMPRVSESQSNDNDDDINEEDATDGGAETKGDESGSIEPLKMLKKGAVAAVGGTMVGVGLVMIPLPTPFGAVVASSGLAVLGTEFGEAKELNDRLIGGAKGHFNNARDSIVKGIEDMNKDFDADTSGDLDINNTLVSDGDFSEKEAEKAAVVPVIKINAAATFESDSDIVDGDESENNENNESGDTPTEAPPVWLHMNPIERTRQEKLAKEKYRRENQTPLEQAKEAMTKRTGKFLSKNVLPFIKKKDPSALEDKPDEKSASTSPKNIFKTMNLLTSTKRKDELVADDKPADLETSSALVDNDGNTKQANSMNNLFDFMKKKDSSDVENQPADLPTSSEEVVDDGNKKPTSSIFDFMKKKDSSVVENQPADIQKSPEEVNDEGDKKSKNSMNNLFDFMKKKDSSVVENQPADIQTSTEVVDIDGNKISKNSMKNLFDFMKKKDPPVVENKPVEVGTSIEFVESDVNPNKISVAEEGTGKKQTIDTVTNKKPDTKDEELQKIQTSEADVGETGLATEKEEKIISITEIQRDPSLKMEAASEKC